MTGRFRGADAPEFEQARRRMAANRAVAEATHTLRGAARGVTDEEWAAITGPALAETLRGLLGTPTDPTRPADPTDPIQGDQP